MTLQISIILRARADKSINKREKVQVLLRVFCVVQNLPQKRAFPSSAQGLLTLSAQAISEVAHSSSFCFVSNQSQ